MSALLIDEAQSLPHDLLEETRLLANMETATDKLLPVVLAGQPELADRLNEPSLRQLKQRVALRCDLAPLQLGETASYIAGRLDRAGGKSAEIFTREAVEVIHARSQGIPRTISVICDNALIHGFAADCRPVHREIVLEVCRDLDLAGQAEKASVPQPSAETLTLPIAALKGPGADGSGRLGQSPLLYLSRRRAGPPSRCSPRFCAEAASQYFRATYEPIGRSPSPGTAGSETTRIVVAL